MINPINPQVRPPDSFRRDEDEDQSENEAENQNENDEEETDTFSSQNVPSNHFSKSHSTRMSLIPECDSDDDDDDLSDLDFEFDVQSREIDLEWDIMSSVAARISGRQVNPIESLQELGIDNPQEILLVKIDTTFEEDAALEAMHDFKRDHHPQFPSQPPPHMLSRHDHFEESEAPHHDHDDQPESVGEGARELEVITDERGGLVKRIVLNPPASFLQAAALISIPNVNEPIGFGTGGQAIMGHSQAVLLSPNPLNPSTSSDTSSPNGVDDGTGQLEIPGLQSLAGLSTDSPTPSNSGIGQQGVPFEVSPSSLVVPSSTQTPSSISNPSVSSVETSTTIPTQTSSSITTENTDTSTPTSSSTLSSSPNTRVSSINPTSLSHTTLPTLAAVISTSLSISSPTSSNTNTNTIPPSSSSTSGFTHSVGFIMLMVLLGLILIGALATLFSFLGRPCRSEPDHEDGLSDIVNSFTHSPSRTSSIRSMRSNRSTFDNPASSLQRRASAFASVTGQSPFLHSGTAFEGYDEEHEEESMGVEQLGHEMDGMGKLEVRNGIPEEMGGQYRQSGEFKRSGEFGTPRESVPGSTPRFMGLEDGGLDTPWGKPLEPTHNPYLAALHNPNPDPDPVQPPFSSPPASITDHPTRASTWASNLRQTLFSAITGRPSEPQEDRYTRTVLPLHRHSTRRRDISAPSRYVEHEKRDGGFEVIDEKDESPWMGSEMSPGSVRERGLVRRDSESPGVGELVRGDSMRSVVRGNSMRSVSDGGWREGR
ncbi:hypothetical protein M231_02482 [Tremella mesenterica]|uniref:Uncharacterized protein n=1 Tax=Tremella mesenterica TaxID=5217 RepID=A0A4Q1BQJ4_TREME|nr:hypothetical protein M231_02482 [Tremella mesenterica]